MFSHLSFQMKNVIHVTTCAYAGEGRVLRNIVTANENTDGDNNNKKEMFPVQPLVVRNWPNHDKHNYSLSLFMIIIIIIS